MPCFMGISEMTDTNELRKLFTAWANNNGYDIANVHDVSKVQFLNPMTRDLWFAYLAGDAAKEIGTIARSEVCQNCVHCIEHRDASFVCHLKGIGTMRLNYCEKYRNGAKK
jgi:hypothetical protein